MTPESSTPRRMPANLELALRIVGLGAILVATLVDEAYSRWLAVGGGLWLAGDLSLPGGDGTARTHPSPPVLGRGVPGARRLAVDADVTGGPEDPPAGAA